MSGANIMQRVFDIMRSSPELLTVDALCNTTHYDRQTVLKAISRLRAQRLLTAVCSDRTWRYGVRPSAQRPVDKRGRQAS